MELERKEALPKPHPILGFTGNPDFETKAQVAIVQRDVIRKTSSKRTRTQLKECLRDIRNRTVLAEALGCIACCAVCNHRVRVELVTTVTKAVYHKGLRGAHCTLLNLPWRQMLGELATFDYETAFREIEDAFKKAALELNVQYSAVCVLEQALVDLPITSGLKISAPDLKKLRYWGSHFHVEVMARRPLELARRAGEILDLKGEKHHAPYFIRPSYTIGRHLAYVTKFPGERLALGKDARGNMKPKSLPLSDHFKRELFGSLADMNVKHRIRLFGQLQVSSRLKAWKHT